MLDFFYKFPIAKRACSSGPPTTGFSVKAGNPFLFPSHLFSSAKIPKYDVQTKRAYFEYPEGFTFETVLSTRRNLDLSIEAKNKGYFILLHTFACLQFLKAQGLSYRHILFLKLPQRKCKLFHQEFHSPGVP